MKADLEARLLAHSIVDPATGCRRWTAYRTANGYGRIQVDNRLRSAHVVAHEVWIGPIPEGCEVDHVHARGCRYRDCIEPSHLEAVTHAENVCRAAELVTHCPQGHELTPGNIKWKPPRPGSSARRRSCRRCFNDGRNRRRVALGGRSGARAS